MGQSVFRFRQADSGLRTGQVWPEHVHLRSLCPLRHIGRLDNALATAARLIQGATFSVRALSESERLLVVARRPLRRLDFANLVKIGGRPAHIHFHKVLAGQSEVANTRWMHLFHAHVVRIARD